VIYIISLHFITKNDNVRLHSFHHGFCVFPTKLFVNECILLELIEILYKYNIVIMKQNEWLYYILEFGRRNL